MELNLTITISVIIALIALISPVAVAIINNRYHMKLRKLELQHEITVKQMDVYYSDKKQAYDRFLKIAGAYRLCPTPTNLGELQSAAYSAVLFCNQENKANIQSFIKAANEELDQSFSIEKRRKYSEALFSLSSLLNDELINLKNRSNTN